MKINKAQYSTLKQLKELYIIANQNGLYDAADIVMEIIQKNLLIRDEYFITCKNGEEFKNIPDEIIIKGL